MKEKKRTHLYGPHNSVPVVLPGHSFQRYQTPCTFLAATADSLPPRPEPAPGVLEARGAPPVEQGDLISYPDLQNLTVSFITRDPRSSAAVGTMAPLWSAVPRQEAGAPASLEHT